MVSVSVWCPTMQRRTLVVVFSGGRAALDAGPSGQTPLQLVKLPRVSRGASQLAMVLLGESWGAFTGVTAARGLRSVPEQKVDPPPLGLLHNPHSALGFEITGH